MIAFAAVAVLVVVVVGVTASRFWASRAERRSLDTYERTLDLLGDVAKRSDAVADVHVPTKDELARPHVTPATGRIPAPRGGGAVRIIPPARVRLESPTPRGAPAGSLPVFGDADLVRDAAAPRDPATVDRAGVDRAGVDQAGVDRAEVDAPVGVTGAAEREAVPVFDFDDLGPGLDDAEEHLAGRVRPARRGGGTGGDRRVRRAAARAAAAVAVVAVGVGGWQIESHSGPSGQSPSQPTTSTTVPARRSTRETPSTTVPPARPARPSALRPTSTSAALVTYAAPVGPYTVTFAAVGGTCWLGAQQQVATTAYLQMWTLSSGQQASYHANGPLVVKIGAPHYVKMAVDGIPVVLPPGNVQPYDVSFTAGSGTPA